MLHDTNKESKGAPSTHSQGLWADGGVARFYKGFTPAILRAAPANGVMLATVDKVGNYLRDK